MIRVVALGVLLVGMSASAEESHAEHTKVAPDPHAEHTKVAPDPHAEHTKVAPDPQAEHTKVAPDPHAAHRAVQPKDRIEQVPDEMEEVGIDDGRLGSQLPLETVLVDEEGKEVTVKELLDGDKPALLTFVYFRCPAICKPLLEYLADSLGKLDISVGQEYQVFTISIDPRETRTLTKVTKQRMIARYGRPSAKADWHFLRGKEEEIKALTAAAGFRYNYLPETNDFAHPGTLIVLTPEGKVSHYLPGIPQEVDVQSRTIKLALVEASDGELGSAIDWFVLTCYHYDPNRGAYALEAKRFMSLAGGVVVLVLVLILVPRWIRDARRRS